MPLLGGLVGEAAEPAVDGLEWRVLWVSPSTFVRWWGRGDAGSRVGAELCGVRRRLVSVGVLVWLGLRNVKIA